MVIRTLKESCGLVPLQETLRGKLAARHFPVLITFPNPSERSNMKKDIGIAVKPPEKGCEDPECPWHGRLSIRGRVFQGSVRSSKAHNTIIVEWGYHRFVSKYESYERRKSRITAHNPPCIHAREGDFVMVAECRPLSKTKKFVVVANLGKAKLEVRGEEQKIVSEAIEKPEEKEKPAEKPKKEKPSKEAKE